LSHHTQQPHLASNMWLTPPSADAGLDWFILLSSAFHIVGTLMGKKLDGGGMTYSKFAHGFTGRTVSSRLGMLIIYGGALALAVYYAGTAPPGSRQVLIARALGFHFGKREFEVLFVHVYSGSMPLLTPLPIAAFYTLFVFVGCHYAAQAPPLADDGDVAPTVLLAVFVVGLLGNLYHHCLLANLRTRSTTSSTSTSTSKKYSVPRGGLFHYVAAPHYLCEVVSLLGMALLTRHWLVVAMVASSAVYLGDRAVAQTVWNRKTFGVDYPAARKHMVPFVF
jgi:hypothetical protein